MVAKHQDRKRAEAQATKGIGVITLPDIRWGRVDIKTVGLLANVLAKQAARDAGAREAWLIDRDGYVTEGGSSNAWIVTTDGVLVTRPEGPDILSGITRRGVIDTAAKLGLSVEFRAFTVTEALAAREGVQHVGVDHRAACRFNRRTTDRQRPSRQHRHAIARGVS